MPEQGETYSAFIEAALKSEHDRRVTVDARAASITTTSSGFLALVVALSAVVVGKDFTFSGWSAGGVVIALVCFAAASMIALTASVARPFEVAAADTLTDMVTVPHWMDDEVDARNITAGLNIKSIGTLRDGNNTKAERLLRAIWIQFAGYVFLICAASLELWDHLA